MRRDTKEKATGIGCAVVLFCAVFAVTWAYASAVGPECLVIHCVRILP